MIIVNFSLKDSAGRPTKATLHISPVNSPVDYSGSVISARTVDLHENYGTASTSLVPNCYEIRELGYNGTTWFYMDISNVADNTTISASDYIVSVPPYPNFTASYSLNAATASYASNVGNPVFYNATTGLNYSITIGGTLGNEWINFQPVS